MKLLKELKTKVTMKRHQWHKVSMKVSSDVLLLVSENTG